MQDNDKMHQRPLIKICGLTRIEDAKAVLECNVDLVGFVIFYPKSKRNVQEDTANLLKSYIKSNNSNIKAVAVTVSPSLEELKCIEKLGFDYIQIHGELKKEVLEGATIPIFRAYNIEDSVTNELALKEDKIKAVVFDGKIPGNGEIFDWSLLKNYNRRDKMLMLAGGLTDLNVERAINEVHPDIVDVSSFVEYEGEFRGKDPDKIKTFVNAVRSVKIV